MPEESETDRRKELDKEISTYISVLRRKEKGALLSFLKSLKRKVRPKAELHPEVKAYGEGNEGKKKPNEEAEKDEEGLEKEFEEGAQKKTFWEWLKGILMFEKKPEESLEEAGEMEAEELEEKKEESPEEEIEEEYQEEVQKQSWISKLIDKIFVKSREEEELEEASDEIAEDIQDMKAIAEIATNVMKMLPKEKMKEFKEGEEFQKFKEILKKRNLIK